MAVSVALQETTGEKLTCMVSPQFTYDDEQEPDGSEVAYYLKQLKEQDGNWAEVLRTARICLFQKNLRLTNHSGKTMERP